MGYLGDKIFIRSSTCQEDVEAQDGPSIKRQMVTIDPKDLIGRTCLKDAEDDGQLFRDRVVRAVVYKEDDLKKGSEYMKFIVKYQTQLLMKYLHTTRILIALRKRTMKLITTLSSCTSFVALLHIKDLYNNQTKITKDCHLTC